MTSPVYSFSQSLALGEAREAVLDEYFKRWYVVEPVGMELQRLGVDRIYTRYLDGARYTVEYKSDDKAADTGNLFIETMSVDTQHKLGWALTSVSQYLFFYVPSWRRVHIARTLTVRGKLGEWAQHYPSRRTQNATYCSEGLIVPAAVVAAICVKVAQL